MKRGRKVGQCFAEYALYKGEEFLDIGTADALSKKWNISKRSIQWYAYARKAKTRCNNKGGYVVLKLDAEEEERV